MAKQKEERVSLNIITPAGSAVWPKLNAPDEYKGKRTFNTKLVIDPNDDALLGTKNGNLVEAAHAMRDEFLAKTKEALKAQADALRKEKKGAKAKEVAAKIDTIEAVDFGKPEVDDESEEETGMLVISAKTNAEYKDKKGKLRERSLTIFDAAGKKLKNAPEIGSGSTLKLAATMVPYYMPAENTVGVTLYLDAVQIIDLVTFGGQRDAGSYGFGAVDGYRGSDDEEEAEEEEADEADSDKPNF